MAQGRHEDRRELILAAHRNAPFAVAAGGAFSNDAHQQTDRHGFKSLLKVSHRLHGRGAYA
ncbi:hypothetical protein PSP6_210306 [Paraburkholderia tropica]|nr:hypothetical protein PSP6_210306 [Paraburkholderia tropica]